MALDMALATKERSGELIIGFFMANFLYLPNFGPSSILMALKRHLWYTALVLASM